MQVCGRSRGRGGLVVGVPYGPGCVPSSLWLRACRTVPNAVDHPNVIQYIGSYIADGNLNILMEYAKGGDLSGVIKSAVEKKQYVTTASHSAVCRFLFVCVNDQPLDGWRCFVPLRRIPERQIWTYFMQLAQGLDHIHGRRILHRDLKVTHAFVRDVALPTIPN